MKNRFMIGQYGSFDYNKYHRDFLPGFYGIEACLFDSEQDIANLAKESQAAGFQIGVHFPLRAGVTALRDAQFLSSDNATRTQAYEDVERELAFLSALKPSYVLFHYPKPVILDDRADWSGWRFDDPSEHVFESAYSNEKFREESHALFEWLSEQGRAYGFTPVLEFDALNRYVYLTNEVEDLLGKHSNIKLCLDTARLYLQDRIDPHFDAKTVIRKFAKHAETIHLSNFQMDRNNKVIQKRVPVQPDLDPSEGWAPIADYLQIICAENDRFKVMFEHQSQLVSDQELYECYRWVAELIRSGREAG
ncbi:TIM barrel protein [Paenibacillus sp. MMS18-CY102]|uniref:TIM barrel protein n=1 Tax=Paenibacillus sp. MMS18-CY102 TaxID=2682849 RepID=UPI001365F180|nr:TIM barrel protein [Paenibacillus sp. MMS18-CY102]MWC30279.1 TIM barrel protein [Paenibacillus sp. MMS18-CY102]